MLSFSDGSDVPVGPISRSGTTVSLGRSGKTSTFVRFSVLSVEDGTDEVGLAEIRVYGFEAQGSDRRRHAPRSRSQLSAQRH